MKRAIILLLIFLTSCGNRQSKKDLQKDSDETKTEITSEATSETTSETTTNSLFDLFEKNSNFSIKPIGDLPAKFIFIHNGQKIEGETTGEINFSNQEKKVSQKTEIITKIQEIFRIKSVYRIHNVHRTLTKTKESISKRSEIAWYLLCFSLGTFVGVAAWEFIRKNNPRNLFKNLFK